MNPGQRSPRDVDHDLAYEFVQERILDVFSKYQQRQHVVRHKATDTYWASVYEMRMDDSDVDDPTTWKQVYPRNVVVYEEKKPLPTSASEADEAAFWATHSTEDYAIGETVEVRVAPGARRTARGSARSTAWERLKALSDLGGRDPDNREYDEEQLQNAAIAYATSVHGAGALGEEILRLDERVRTLEVALAAKRTTANRVCASCGKPSFLVLCENCAP